MSIKKLLIALHVFVLVQSCISPNITNGTSCEVYTDKIEKILKSRGYRVIGRINLVSPEVTNNRLVRNCVGYYSISVEDSNKLYTEFNFVSIPVLVTDDNIHINTSSLNGKKFDSNHLDSSIDSILNLFENKYESSFTQNELAEIKERFSYGIASFNRGRR
ncbi:MAG: hypothetical protein AAF849_04870 [Bacteroidota bacterium]